MFGSRNIINLTLGLNNNRAHLFDLSLSLDCALPYQIFSLPAWTPGSYMMREFIQHMVSLHAQENGESILVAKTNKNTFRLENSSPHLNTTYQVYGFDSSIRAAFIDNQQ